MTSGEELGGRVKVSGGAAVTFTGRSEERSNWKPSDKEWGGRGEAKGRRSGGG